ncbi:MAG: VWA domain-containing protein [Acidobacteriales bacterium]|nr:VWA domain-containing protein [Terriglobales bacterium]
MFDQFSAFHFLRSQWLWLLAPAALLYLVVLRHEDVSKRWKEIIAPELLEKLLVGRHRRWRFRPVHSTCLAIALAALGMAGPTWKREQPPFTEDKAPLVIALDISRDMNAIDVQPTRLERAKLKIHDLMKVRQGSQTALFVYGSDAHMVLPLTADESLMNLYVQAISSDLIPPGAKDTAGAIHKIDTFLENETVPGTILFITCGIERRAFPSFARRNDDMRQQILVLGIGTVQGGPLRTASGQFVTEDGRRVFSKLDLESLKALNKQADIPISTITIDDDDVKWVQRHALSHLQAVQQSDAHVQWVDQGYWFVIPVALLTALWFRKGWTLRWTTAGLAVLFLFHAPSAEAREFHFIDLWLTPDQQGRYYYQRGDYATAAERFENPMWKGLALCREKDYQAALNAFALVDTPESWFDQGNALTYLKKYPEAVQAYNEALARRPHWRAAEDNLALVRSLIPPPPKKSDEEQEVAPDLKPDQIKFDEKGKKGKKGRASFGKEEMAEIWMRNIQTSPADFLRRKFAIESAEDKHR